MVVGYWLAMWKRFVFPTSSQRFFRRQQASAQLFFTHLFSAVSLLKCIFVLVLYIFSAQLVLYTTSQPSQSQAPLATYWY